MKNLMLFFVSVTILAFSISGCSKGTAGPAGPAGRAGPAGPDSIIYSQWIVLSMSVQVDSLNDSLWSQTIAATSLTSAIIDNGAVLSYIGIPGSGTSGTDTAVFSISEASTYFGSVTQNFFVGEIDLFSLINYSQSLYRYVLIPGNILTSSIFKQYSKAQLRGMDLNTIKKLLATASSMKTTN
jgi:hypothetical protein